MLYGGWQLQTTAADSAQHSTPSWRYSIRLSIGSGDDARRHNYKNVMMTRNTTWSTVTRNVGHVFTCFRHNGDLGLLQNVTAKAHTRYYDRYNKHFACKTNTTTDTERNVGTTLIVVINGKKARYGCVVNILHLTFTRCAKHKQNWSEELIAAWGYSR